MPLTSRIYWIFKAFDRPLPDVALESILKDVPGGSVRGARKRLEKEGLIRVAGWVGRGRRKRRTWRLA